MSTRRVTLRDVADAAKAAVGTVSAALNGTGRIRPERRAEIVRIARELNYEPNLAAQLMRVQTKPDVGLVIHEAIDLISGHGMYQGMIGLFSSMLAMEEMRGRLELVDARQSADQVPALITSGLIGGVLLSGAVQPAVQAWLRDHADFPYVIVEETGEYSVATDVGTGVERAVGYLAALGHHRVAIGVGSLRFPSQRQALAGYRRAVANGCLDDDEAALVTELRLVSHTASIREGMAWARGLLERPAAERPTALFCNDMRIARAATAAALGLGLRVPQDVSVVGFGGDWEAQMSAPLITAVEWDTERILQTAMGMLRDRMQGNPVEARQLLLPPRFEVRDTTGPAPGAAAGDAGDGIGDGIARGIGSG